MSDTNNSNEKIISNESIISYLSQTLKGKNIEIIQLSKDKNDLQLMLLHKNHEIKRLQSMLEIKDGIIQVQNPKMN